MKVEGDGRQYWLVLNPDPDQERMDRVLELLKEVWSRHKEVEFREIFNKVIYHSVMDHTDEELIRTLEENL